MTRNKKITIATLAIAITMLTTGSAAIAQAHQKGNNQHQPLSVYHHRKASLEKRLNKAVEDGKISAQQRDELLAKIKDNHDNIKDIRRSDKTNEEKKSAIQTLRNDMKQWLKDHNIDPTIILPKRFRR